MGVEKPGSKLLTGALVVTLVHGDFVNLFMDVDMLEIIMAFEAHKKMITFARSNRLAGNSPPAHKTHLPRTKLNSLARKWSPCTSHKHPNLS